MWTLIIFSLGVGSNQLTTWQWQLGKVTGFSSNYACVRKAEEVVRNIPGIYVHCIQVKTSDYLQTMESEPEKGM